MPLKTVAVPIVGLSLEPNKLQGAPIGSLLVADNVVLRAPGTLEPAPRVASIAPLMLNGGTTDYAVLLKSFGDAWNNYVTSIVRTGPKSDPTFTTGLHMIDVDPSDSTDEHLFAFVSQSADNDPRPMLFEAGRSFCTFSRDRRIFTSEGTPITLTRTPDDSDFEVRLSGLQAPGGIVLGGFVTANGAESVPASSAARYRATFIRKYPTYDLESAPTAPATVYTSPATVQDGFSLQIYTQSATTPVREGDILVIYRTPWVDDTQDPGAEYQEAERHTMTATDIADGFVSLTDHTANVQLGAMLYTNPSQEGSGQANYPPPDSHCVATYNDTTFYALNRDWPTLSLSISDYGDINAGAAVGDLAAHSAAILHPGATSITLTGNLTAFIKVGMVLKESFIGAFGYVTGVSLSGGNTVVTFDGSYGLPGGVPADIPAGSAISVLDTIRFDCETYAEGQQQYLYTLGANAESIPASLAYPESPVRGIIVTAIDTTEPPRVALTFTVNQVGRIKSFTVHTTKGDAYSQLDTVDSNGFGIKASTQSTNTAQFYWSKTSFPEAVPPDNHQFCGHGSILRFISDNNSLYAACTDGVYRITGNGDDWTVVQLSRSHRIVHADAAANVGGRVFMGCSSGVFLVSESGLENVSDEAIGPSLQTLAMAALELYTGSWGIYLASDDLRRELYVRFGPYDEATDTWQTSSLFVLNLRSSGWTTRSALPSHTEAFVPGLGRAYWGDTRQNGLGQQQSYLYYEDPSLGWEEADVIWNQLTAGAPGVLKQWIDCNLLGSAVAFIPADSTFSYTQFMFDTERKGDVFDFNLRRSTAWSFPREHCFVPRRCALRDTLIPGFFTYQGTSDDSGSMYFKLYGITVRYRQASETFQR